MSCPISRGTRGNSGLLVKTPDAVLQSDLIASDRRYSSYYEILRFV
jgi:hypothetical protein